jgi:hypothetical protein
MGIAYNTSTVRDGLVLHLDAANPKSYPGSGTVWTDLTKNGYNATLIGSPSYNVTEKFISFNGTNQYSSTSVLGFSSGSQAYTFEVLFKMRTLPTAEYAANGHIWGGRMGDHIVLYVNPAVNGRSTLNMNHDDARYAATGAITNGTIAADEWVHWIVSWSVPSYTFTHYLNGVVDKQGIGTLAGQESKLWPSTGAIAYDSRWLTYSTLDIAVLKQYNKILSINEAQQNFEALRGRYGI